MTERPHKYDRYVGMNPQERQHELQLFISNIPYSLVDTLYPPENDDKTIEVFSEERLISNILSISEDMARRKSGESIEVLKERWNQLLAYAPITQSFQERIMEWLGTSYMMGISIEDGDKLSWLIRPEYETQGGIFSQEQAKTIEHEGYQRFLDWHLSISDEESFWGKIRSQNGTILTNWRQEFIKKYQTEP